MKLKHSKYKNTGLIFDILTKQVISEALSNKKDTAYKILQEHFKATSPLAKELKLYQALSKSHSKTAEYSERLCDLVIEARGMIDSAKLDQAKFQLIGALKKHYNLKSLFEIKIPTYATNATIYKAFEYKRTESPVEYIEASTLLREQLQASPAEKIKDQNYSLLETQDPDTRKLVHKMILNKFNEKYQSLNESQRKLLTKFISSNTEDVEFKNYVVLEASRVRKELSQKVLSDKALQIKLNEAVNLLEKIISSKTIQVEHLSALLKYYELVEVL